MNQGYEIIWARVAENDLKEIIEDILLQRVVNMK